MTPSTHLRLNNVTKRFGHVTAVEHINLEIPRGSFATLLGPSGCGKTTLLRMIAGFYEPDEGTIYLADRRIDDLPAHRRGTAMVFQDYALFPHMQVFDNVAYGLRLAKMPRERVDKRVNQTLEFVGLSGLSQRWPQQLSGGQQQRVALARALVIEPEVLLLDEPLSNLDANLREQLRWELRTLQQRLNITFVYVTHDQAEALAMSDWIAVMSNGRVEQWGSPWVIYYQPRTPFLASFVGQANLQSAQVVERGGGTLTVKMLDKALQLAAPDMPIDEKVLLCIRPETITIGNAPPNSATFVSLDGTVVRHAFLGHVMRYWIKIGDDEWIVDDSDPGASHRVYEGNVAITINTKRVHVIAK